MAQTNLTVRIDENIKREAEILFNNIGLNMSSAVNIFFRQAIREQAIPFELKPYDGLSGVAGSVASENSGNKPSPETNEANKAKMSRADMFGCMRGKFKMADDFNEPLEDFEEYMR